MVEKSWQAVAAMLFSCPKIFLYFDECKSSKVQNLISSCHAFDQVLKNAVLFAGTFLGMMLVVSGVSICVMDKTLWINITIQKLEDYPLKMEVVGDNQSTCCQNICAGNVSQSLKLVVCLLWSVPMDQAVESTNQIISNIYLFVIMRSIRVF